MHLKTLANLSTAILLCLSLNSLFAQPAQYRSQLNKMEMNQNLQRADQQMQLMMQTMHMRGVQSTEQEYDFTITLRDNTTREVTSAIYTDTVAKKCFIVLIDKKYKKSDPNRYKKIYPSQTLNLTCALEQNGKDDMTAGQQFRGIPKDTCWMFKVISGRINAYSFLVINENILFYPETIVGIQLNDGPIVQFNEANLKSMIINDSHAMESLEDNGLLKAILRFNNDMNKEGKK